MSHRSKNSNNGLFRQTAAALHFTRQFHEFLSRMYRSSIVSSLYNIAHAALHYILQLTVHMHYTTSGVVNSKSVTEVMTELRSSPLLLPLVSVALPPPLYLLLSLPLPPLVVLPSPLPPPSCRRQRRRRCRHGITEHEVSRAAGSATLTTPTPAQCTLHCNVSLCMRQTLCSIMDRVLTGTWKSLICK